MIFEAMIVDDEAPARAELTDVLNQVGRVHVVAEAVCLQEAIAKIREGGIDIVFMDCTIAGAGSDLLVKALPTFDFVPPFVFLTAYKDYVSDPFGVEPVGRLVKPISSHALSDVLDKITQQWTGELMEQQAKTVRSGDGKAGKGVSS